MQASSHSVLCSCTVTPMIPPVNKSTRTEREEFDQSEDKLIRDGFVIGRDLTHFNIRIFLTVSLYGSVILIIKGMSL